MNRVIILRCIIIILLLFAVSANMHSAYAEDSLSVRTQFIKNLQTAGDAALRIRKRTIDSLSQNLQASNSRHRASLKTLKDSLLASTGKELDPKRIESIGKLHTRLSNNLNSNNQKRQQLMYERLQKHQRTIQNLITTYLPCHNCKEYRDYENALHTFNEKSDLSTNAFFDAASEEFENASDALIDTADILRDSLISYIETLIDERSAELDEAEEHSNKIILSMDAKSHTSYRGRDGGVSQAALSPSVTLALNSGLHFSLGTGWTEKPEFHRDGTYLGIGYNFNISPIMGASIGYTYLSYTDSSTQNQSVFNHSIDGAIYLETSLANLGTNAGVSIGSEIEYAISASVSKSIPIGNVSLDPSLIITWGEQNGELIAERLTKALKGQGKSQGKGKGGGQQAIDITTTYKNIFTLMSYEIMLPLNIHIGTLTITPSVSGIIPVNVNDGSREAPYLNAGLTVGYELKL